jgi:hypothetical protein
MSNYTSYFLNSNSSVVQLELFTISHPSFLQTYNLVRNATNGITVTLETGLSQFFDYLPMKVAITGRRDNLDQLLELTLGDLGLIIPQNLDAVFMDGSATKKPSLIYRTYRSDQLNAPLLGPISLEIKKITFSKEGALIQAQAPSLNINRTGEYYSTERFSGLKAFL